MTTKTKKRSGNTDRATENGRARKRRSEAADVTDRLPARRKKQKPIEDVTDNDRACDRQGGEGVLVTEHPGAAQNTTIDETLIESVGCDVDQQQSGSDRTGDAECVVAKLCCEIQELQRCRRGATKLRVMLENGTAAFVATMTGYRAGLEEKERKKLFADAQKMVVRIDKGDEESGSEDTVAPIVRITAPSRLGFADYEKQLLKKMSDRASLLPVAPWFDHPDRRGIKLTMLATIIGEAGDLSNYPNPAKLWKRLFGAPYEKKGKTQMPSQWRRGGGLAAEEWETIGYSPRRNAATYQLRENIVMQNREGPYRKRYDEAKAKSKENSAHSEWTDMHHHNHAQLLAAKRFVLDFWKEWKRAGSC